MVNFIIHFLITMTFTKRKLEIYNLLGYTDPLLMACYSWLDIKLSNLTIKIDGINNHIYYDKNIPLLSVNKHNNMTLVDFKILWKPTGYKIKGEFQDIHDMLIFILKRKLNINTEIRWWHLSDNT